jgi:hypothetical protein
MTIRTFGSDPEFLLVKNNRPHSAIGVVQGTSDNRITVNDHQFYYDNVLAECAIKPGNSKNEVLDNFRECFSIYADMVRPLRMTTVAYARFPKDQLRHEDARKVGCAIDNCAYEQKQMEAPKDAIEKGDSRSCGGHVHLGSDLLASNGPEPVLQIFLLDLFVGVPSLYLDRDPTSHLRRLIYGAAGRYRNKDYGVEYRSLSNFWLASPRLTGLVYDLCMFAHDFLEDGRVNELWRFDEEVFYSSSNMADAYVCLGYDADALRGGINLSEKNLVAEHWELVKEKLPAGLLADLTKAIDREPDDFYRDWQLPFGAKELR